LPSACTAIDDTELFAFGSNESAKPVVASSRAMKLRVCPPMLCRSRSDRNRRARIARAPLPRRPPGAEQPKTVTGQLFL
jgi:hypothetical protein